MVERWRARDLGLLDALDALPRVPVEAAVWRVVREGQDPLLCRSSRGRWDLGHFEVLYTALESDGALAEMYFHLSRQPVFPSKVAFTLNEIEVRTIRTLRLADLSDLASLGVDPQEYSSILYRQTQEIGDAAAFLGFDGLIAPSARWDNLNLIVVCPNLPEDGLVLKSSSKIDWEEWRGRHGRPRP